MQLEQLANHHNLEQGKLSNIISKAEHVMNCYKLLNVNLDIEGFTQLLKNIERSNDQLLKKIYDTYNTNFVQLLQYAVFTFQSDPLYQEIMGIKSFPEYNDMFTKFYKNLNSILSDKTRKPFVKALIDFYNSVKYILEYDKDKVNDQVRELESAIESCNKQLESNFMDLLISGGVHPDVISKYKNFDYDSMK